MYVLFTGFTTRASLTLHAGMLQKLVRAPTDFFDVTPIGRYNFPSSVRFLSRVRITNRFAKELSNVDTLLPIQLINYVNSIFSIIGMFAAIMFASYWLIFVIVPMVVFYVWFQWYYRHTSVELQRMEALSRAPILSHLAETMSMKHIPVTLFRWSGIHICLRC